MSGATAAMRPMGVESEAQAQVQAEPSAVRPRLGFLGTGWIGRLRMQALLEADVAQLAAVHDPSEDAARAAAELGEGSRICASVEELLTADIDGVVIATPSALHAAQCIEALRLGKAVFCQKPLARTADETRRIIAAARAADRLLEVDFSYRHLAGVDELRRLIRAGELGDIFASDLVFHNAYGPDKPWFHDIALSGGGCVMDLGIHLVDLALWLLGNTQASDVSARLFRHGKRLEPAYEQVEDYAVADFTLGETRVHLCCSWNLHAGRDAVIEVSLHGSRGGACIRNVNGSFYDFEVLHFSGTSSRQIAAYPDAWGGRALVSWAQRLAGSPAFDPCIEQVVRVADLMDRIYSR